MYYRCMGKSKPLSSFKSNDQSQSISDTKLNSDTDKNKLVEEIIMEINESKNSNKQSTQSKDVSNNSNDNVDEYLEQNHELNAINDEVYNIKLQEEELDTMIQKESNHSQNPKKSVEGESNIKTHFEHESKDTRQISNISFFLDKLKNVFIVFLLVSILSFPFCDVLLLAFLPDTNIITNNTDIVLSVIKGLIASIIYFGLSFIL